MNVSSVAETHLHSGVIVVKSLFVEAKAGRDFTTLIVRTLMSRWMKLSNISSTTTFNDNSALGKLLNKLHNPLYTG